MYLIPGQPSSPQRDFCGGGAHRDCAGNGEGRQWRGGEGSLPAFCMSALLERNHASPLSDTASVFTVAVGSTLKYPGLYGGSKVTCEGELGAG